MVLRYVIGEATEPVLHTTEITLTELGPRHTRISLLMRFPTIEARLHAAERYGAVEGGHQTLARLATLLEALQGAPTDSHTLRVRRVLAATPSHVWLALTEASQLGRWLHPAERTIFAFELDLRVGGAFLHGFRGPGPPDTRSVWRFTELDAPRRLRFEQSFVDAHGRVIPSPSGDPWPHRLDMTLTLEPHAGISGGTLLTLACTPQHATPEEHAAFDAARGALQAVWDRRFEALARAVLQLPDSATVPVTG